MEAALKSRAAANDCLLISVCHWMRGKPVVRTCPRLPDWTAAMHPCWASLFPMPILTTSGCWHTPLPIPVGMGAAARRILAAAAPFLPGNRPAPAPGWDFQSGQSFDIDPFQVTPFLVDHSAYDAYALLVDSGGTQVSSTVVIFVLMVRKAALFERLVVHPPMKVDALLLEGSSLGRLDDDQQFPTESDIEAQLVRIFSATDGLALVHTSAQNIDRVVSIMRASKTNR